MSGYRVEAYGGCAEEIAPDGTRRTLCECEHDTDEAALACATPRSTPALARAAFEAYGASTGGKTWDGKPIPPFDVIRTAEVILPRRAHAQPSPHRVAVGDCGACALGGLLGRSVDEAYAIVRDDGPPRSIGWPEMREAVGRLAASGPLSRAMVDVPLWPHAVPSMCLTWGLSAPWQSHAWWSYATTAMDAGLYGLACVSSRCAGSDSEGPDHWVLIVGYRTRYEATGPDSGRIHDELLVSCSARHPEGRWIDRNDFLRKWGGFNTLWARPA